MKENPRKICPIFSHNIQTSPWLNSVSNSRRQELSKSAMGTACPVQAWSGKWRWIQCLGLVQGWFQKLPLVQGFAAHFWAPPVWDWIGGGIWTLFGNVSSEVQLNRDVKEEITWSWLIPHIIQSGLTVCQTLALYQGKIIYLLSMLWVFSCFFFKLQSNSKINPPFKMKSNCASKWEWLVARVESTGSSEWKSSILPAITLFRMLLESCFT